MNTYFGRRLAALTVGVAIAISPGLFAIGCGSAEEQPRTTHTSTRNGLITSTTTGAATTAQQGLKLDPNLTSITGTPAPDEMKTLIVMQAKVPYPVMVPTYLPGGYILETELVGASGPTARDAIGYYSFRYIDPGNPNRVLTFNQSRANSTPLAGYYVTDASINGIDFQVYWHKTRDYLPENASVPAESVGDAETFVVIWKGQFTDAAGQPQDLFFSLNTGSWTGHGWGDIRNILESLKPLESVGS
ncbi:MAG: hypothetical protein ACYC6B_03075 [Thermoleophilia bacterium]